MSAFYYIIIKAINDYKSLIRKTLSSKDATAKVRQFAIKRKQLKAYTPVKLYEIAQQIAADLAQQVKTAEKAKSPNRYDGSREFLDFLQELLAEHRVEKDKVINTGQKVSRALVTAIQLIGLPEARLTRETATRIDECARVIALSGNEEAIKMFCNAVKKNQTRHESFFDSLSQNFCTYLDDQPVVS